jgi:hypothetical protein
MLSSSLEWAGKLWHDEDRRHDVRSHKRQKPGQVLGLAILATTHLIGYLDRAPIVLRVGGFRILIFLPPREHEPPHVHAWNADGEIVIELAVGDKPQTIRTVACMRTNDVPAAFWIVGEHTEYLQQCRRKYHG